MKTPKLLGLMALAAAAMGDMTTPTMSARTFTPRSIPLTPKQQKARAKNKRAKKARKINRP